MKTKLITLAALAVLFTCITAYAEIIRNLTALTGAGADVTNDRLIINDDSANVDKSITLAEARIALGLGTAASPSFTGIELSHATENTLTASSGVLSVEGVAVAMRTGGNTFTGTQVFPSGQALIAPALGTPASVVLTNATGTAAGLTAGTVTTNANLTGHITSTGNAAILGSFTLAQLSTAVSDANIARTDSAQTLTGAQSFGSAGVSITDDGDGAITFLGLGNGSDEDFTFNLDDTANTVVISSSTGVTTFDFGSIDINAGDFNAVSVVASGTVAGGALRAENVGGFSGYLRSTNLTDDRDFELPNAAGTLALLTDIGASDFDALTAATEADLDIDDVLAVSHDGTEKKITTENLIDYLESQAWTFSSIDVTTLNATTFAPASIELSHASANTLTASSGVLSVEGVAVAMRTGGNTFTGTQVFPSGQALIAPALGTIASGVGTALTGLTNLATTAGTATLTSGQINVNTTDKQVGIHNGTREVAIPLVFHREFSFDPKAVCDGAVDRLFLFKVGAWAPKGITVTGWRVSFEADPTTEVDLDLKRATAFIGVGSAAVMDVLDTTAGVSSEATASNINSNAVVANGQCLYLEFGTAYSETTHQMIFEIEYEIEED